MTGPRPTSSLVPRAFAERIRAQLPDDHEAFFASLDRPWDRGLRRNAAKIGHDELESLLGIGLEPVPWCPTGYRLPADTRLGGHPAHLAGLFYLQEPSAMAAAEALAPEPGWAVVDLAAAPGGKTTHLSALVGGGGLVMANEVVPKRLRALHDGLEVWGAANVVTLSASLQDLAHAGVTFDAAVLDAPCSGEALFRRDPAAIGQWSPAAVEGAARRQRELLGHAAELVRPGGALVYSTCSFGLDENEHRVAELVELADGWHIDDCVGRLGASPGAPTATAPTDRTARFWPHRHLGEGQYVARLTRRHRPGAGRSGPAPPPPSPPRSATVAGRGRADRELVERWSEFRRTVLPGLSLPGRLVAAGNRLFLRPEHRGTDRPSLDGFVARPGLPLGRLRPGRFEPHPALATAVAVSDAAQPMTWAGDSVELAAYLRGETVDDPGPDAWVLVCYERWGIGWARRRGGTLKNAFPRHLRRQAVAHQRRDGRV